MSADQSLAVVHFVDDRMAGRNFEAGDLLVPASRAILDQSGSELPWAEISTRSPLLSAGAMRCSQ